ncbi:WhiB family transcriptional regulator [Streptomyces sp. NPDC059916]|uniref:WhiB family transcriptional regulator n=1 Tax=Streptomyces sp. NPDC059916 TaxID=3347001 RepID=UPI0036BEBDCE
MTTQTLNGTSGLISRPLSAAVKTGQQRRAEPFTASWEDRAACYNRPQSWWDGENDAETARARQECLGCPVLEQCLGERMRDEGDEVDTRYGIRGGLTGSQRIQLYVERPDGGGYDAEEARLIALEAIHTGRPVADVAPEDATQTTVRLAARLASEAQPIVVGHLPGDSALRLALSRAADVMAWRERGMTVATIAHELGVGPKTIDTVIQTYRDNPGDHIPGSSSREEAVAAWLAGEDVLCTLEERLEAVRAELAAGKTFAQIDEGRGVKPRTTRTWVSWHRREYRRTGREFPVPLRDKPKLTAASMETAA